MHQVHFPLFGYIRVTSIMCPMDKMLRQICEGQGTILKDTIVGDQGMFKLKVCGQKQLQVASQLNTPGLDAPKKTVQMFEDNIAGSCREAHPICIETGVN